MIEDMKNFFKYICLSVCAALPFAASAQVLPFTAIDYSPVSLAKGSVSTVEMSTPGNAVFANPAVVAFSENKLDVGISYANWSPSQLQHEINSFSASFKLNEKIGLSAGYSYGTYPQYEIFDLAGMSDGMYTPKHSYAGAGFSYLLKPALALGVNLGYASQKLSDKVSYSAIAVDVFAMYRTEKYRAAFGISDLGPAVTSESGDFSLPTAVKAGFGYYLINDENHRVDVMADASYFLSGEYALAAGTEYEFRNMLSLRAGYRYGGETVLPSFASAGLGICIADISIDVAYLLASKNLANTLCVGVSYIF